MTDKYEQIEDFVLRHTFEIQYDNIILNSN